MRKVLKNCLCVVLICSMIAPFALFASADDYMAYNFYSNPDLSGTSGGFDSFMIDFRGTITPNNTYWSLCNFGMYLGSAATIAAYPSIRGYGAYCGLQNRQVSQGKAGILSFWEATYKAPGSTYDSQQGAYMLNGQKVLVNASRMYPSGSSTFTGEGDGTNCIAAYPWETNKWYTMLLHSWTDEETGTTFVGEWFKNVETGEWTLFSYFDTHLYDSYLIGGMSQFQENYWQYGQYNYVAERACNLKNMYAYDHSKNAWKSLNKSTLSYGDGGGKNKAGAHSFGKSSDEDGQFFWASTGGEVADQAAYEAAATQSASYTLTDQPAAPALGQNTGASAQIVLSGSTKKVKWNNPSTNQPQLSYTVKVYDSDEQLVLTKSATRPEVNEVDISEVSTDAIRCEVLINTVFGEQYGASAMTDAYYSFVGASYTLSAAKVTNIDDQLIVTIDMSAEKDIYGFQMEVLYDADKLSFVKGEFGDKFVYARAVEREPGVARILGATALTAPASGEERVVTLTFDITDPDKAIGNTYSFTTDFYDNVPAYTKTDDGTIVYLPLTSINDLTVKVEKSVYDVNANGTVNINDVTALLDRLTYLVNPSSVYLYDVNNDGRFTIADVTALLNFIANM